MKICKQELVVLTIFYKHNIVYNTYRVVVERYMHRDAPGWQDVFEYTETLLYKGEYLPLPKDLSPFNKQYTHYTYILCISELVYYM